MAVDAALWVVSKAVARATDGLLGLWAASSKLGTNVEALKTELLYAQGMLENAKGRDIRITALKQLLNKLRQLAYAADDMLDELDYFRIQDAVDGTNHAADADGFVRNARHAARAIGNKLKLCSSSHDTSHGDHDDQDDGSSKPAVHTTGNHFPCFSLPSVCDNDAVMPESSNMANGRRFLCGARPSKASRNTNAMQTPKLKFDRVEMSKKMKGIVEQLKPLRANVSTLLDKYTIPIPTQDIATNRSKTTPGIIEPKLYGRDNQKKNIVDQLTHGKHSADGLTVLPVVGPGGIGKTSLIKHIYKEVERTFQVLIWICVSHDFNANMLLEEIVKKIPKVEGEKENASNEELIEQRLKSKHLLLVLDDVWTDNEDEWEKLSAPLRNNGGEHANVVIVTTRKPQVASMVSRTNSLIELEHLEKHDMMSFFEECVFGDLEQPWKVYPDLEDTGKEIVNKLKGFPLAAKTVGRLLRNKLTLQDWTKVAESKEWEMQKGPNDIMPALKLSYDYLPFHLQQCYSYCALFPEDYEFCRKELVHFWIGLGILHSHEYKSVEDVALSYLDDLVNHGFLKENREKGDPYYVIHDLLHELAVQLSSDECLSIRSSNVKSMHIPLTIRHLSIIVDNVDVMDRVSFEDYKSDLATKLGTNLEVQNLRTLMLFGEHHGSFIKTFRALFQEARAIRTILLSGASYSVEDMLQNFSKLIHLRYLRIISNDKLSLPTALFRSYHLEVLDLEKWHGSFGLTSHMKNLMKLRHFLVSKDHLELHSNIIEVGKLKFLQELRRFEVGKESEGFELSQLGELTEVVGSLGVYNLENVGANKEAKEHKLLHKKYLRELILEWSNKAASLQENILESLVPHKNLQHLRIKGHGGANCPSWLGQNLSVKNLESLCVYDVSWNTLPPLGELWFINDLGEEFKGFVPNQSFQTLKRLELVKVPKLRKWVGNGTCCLFSCLEVVIIEDCLELVELPFSHPDHSKAKQEENMRTWFPKLGELKLRNCRQLLSLPPIPSTSAPCSIEIENSGSVFQKLVYSKDDESKLRLQIVGKDRQQSMVWSGLAFHNLTDLEELEIIHCPPLPLIHLEKLKSLKRLNMKNMGNTLLWFEGESHKIESPFPVEHMNISSCCVNGKELTQVLSHFPRLTYLWIEYCDKITGMVLNVVQHHKVATSPAGNKTEQPHQQQQIIGEEEFAAVREEMLLLPPQLEELSIWHCPNLVLSTSPGFGGGGEELQSLCSLSSLHVYFCAQFFSCSSSAASCLPFPTSLQHLDFYSVGGTEMLLPLSNLTSLAGLSVVLCGDLRVEGLWPLVAQGSLTSLHIHETPKFFSGAEPSWPNDEESRSSSFRLEYISIPNFEGVFTRPICRLMSSSLGQFSWEDREVQLFTAEQEETLQLLTSLQKLTFCHCEKLQLLPASLTKLTNLKELTIQGSPALLSLPNDGFPSCLENFRISDCPAIKSLPDLPSSLQKLEINKCPAIKSLPSNLPSSLQEIEISNCSGIKSLHKEGLPTSLRLLDVRYGDTEELRRQCHKLKGTIPIVKC